jgi:hypothetical protein
MKRSKQPTYDDSVDIGILEWKNRVDRVAQPPASAVLSLPHQRTGAEVLGQDLLGPSPDLGAWGLRRALVPWAYACATRATS